MHSRQVLSERNLLRANLRDPVLLPITQMLLEINWEYLYNCVCSDFPRLEREFYGHMIVIQDDDQGLIMQTMVKGQTILIDPQLINSVIGVPVLPVSVFLSLLVMGHPALAFFMISLGRDHREKTSPTPRSTSVLLLLCTDF
jgi:DUF1365 family protein